jgi:hypothetical protein
VATTQKKQMKKIYTIIMSFVVSANTFAQAPNCQWATTAGGTGGERGYSVTTDASGNVYVTGYFGGTITFGTTPLTSVGSDDIFIAKYDAAGTVLWATSAGGNSTVNGYSVATDTSGNVYVTGYFYGPTITFGTTTLTNVGGPDVFIAKYDAAGTVLWATSATSAGNSYGNSVATDASGNVYVTGYFESPTITFGTTTLTNTSPLGNSEDIFIAKYDAAGTVLWAKRASGNNSERGYSVTTDASGNVYVTGYFYSPTITFGTTTLTNSGSIDNDIFIVKYDAAGTVLWATSAGGNSTDNGYSVATDTSGNVYVTGRFQSDTITFGTTALTNAGGGSYDIFIAKYDAVGNVLWAKTAGGVYEDEGNSVATDASGNVYVTGEFRSPTITFGTTTLYNAGANYMFIAKYDAAGTVLWATSTTSAGNSYGNSVATDASGNVYVTGYFVGSMAICNTLLNYGNSSDHIFIVKYAGTGTGVGVDELFGNNEVSVSPNPFTSQTTITFNEEQKNTTLYIRDALGNEIRKETFSGKQFVIEKGNITAGIYFVQTTDEKMNVTNNKIIIQ